MDKVRIDIYVSDNSTGLELPYAEEGIQAGFPSPIQDYITERIDLNFELIKHPTATYYGKVKGDSMVGDGIEDGDIIVIDRAVEPVDGDLAVCNVEGELTLKRIKYEQDRIWLVASNELFEPILITPDRRFSVWGVVTYTVKSVRRQQCHRGSST